MEYKKGIMMKLMLLQHYAHRVQFNKAYANLKSKYTQAMAHRCLPVSHCQLCIYKFNVYDFCCFTADVIHSGNPLHLIDRLELFGYALMICHLFYEPKEHFFRLLVDVSKVVVKLACGQQIEVQRLFVLFNIP